jgi:hypothetical protein
MSARSLWSGAATAVFSAEQFAVELGIYAGTLKFWRYKLG